MQQKERTYYGDTSTVLYAGDGSSYVPSTTPEYVAQFEADTAANYPYIDSFALQDDHLTGAKWTNSQGAWTVFKGQSGKGLAISSATPTTTTLTFGYDVATGYKMSVSSFSFYQRSSSTGYAQYTMSINGTQVGSGNIFVDIPNKDNPVQWTGDQMLTTAMNNLTGHVTVVITLSGGTNGYNGTFRMDNFSLNGYTVPTSYSNSAPNLYIHKYNYRYGFNGKENDNEVEGEGVQQFFEDRIYDARVGRFISIDSRFRNYTSLSGYSFSGNNPIMFIDDNGRDWHLPKSWWQGKGYGVGLLAGVGDGLIETVESGVDLGKLAVKTSPSYIASHPLETYESAKKAVEITTSVVKGLTDSKIRSQVIESVKSAIGGYVSDISFQNGSTEAGYAQGKLAFNILLLFVGAEEIKGLLQTGKFSAEAIAEINAAKNSGKLEAALDLLGCFVEGTPILTKDGFKQIQLIVEGDSVIAYDFSKHISKQFAVHNPTIKVVDKLVKLTIDHTIIITTLEHPFYTNRGWVSAMDLENTDSIFTINNKLRLSNKLIIDTFQVKVYNFTVEKAHTYYVSNQRLLVHNTCFFKEAEVEVYESGVKIPKKAPILEKLGFQGQDKFRAAENAIKSVKGGENFVMRSEEEATQLLEKVGAKVTRNETGVNAPKLDPSKINKSTNGHFDEHINFEYNGNKATITIQPAKG